MARSIQTLHVALALCLLALPLGSTQAEIYKIVDKDGNVTYSDTPPDEEKAEVTEIKPPPPANTLESEHTKTPQQEDGWLKKIEAQRAEKQEAYDEWYKDYIVAKKALNKAKKALKEGKDPREGDYIGYSHAGGSGTRPSETYLNRVKSLEAGVKKARRDLKRVLKRKPK